LLVATQVVVLLLENVDESCVAATGLLGTSRRTSSFTLTPKSNLLSSFTQTVCFLVQFAVLARTTTMWCWEHILSQYWIL